MTFDVNGVNHGNAAKQKEQGLAALTHYRGCGTILK